MRLQAVAVVQNFQQIWSVALSLQAKAKSKYSAVLLHEALVVHSRFPRCKAYNALGPVMCIKQALQGHGRRFLQTRVLLHVLAGFAM